jgi:hypothetical protein
MVVLLLLAVAANADSRYKREYKKEAFGKKAAVPVLTGASIRQARNSPRQWGRTVSGFGKRAASSLGVHVIKTSIEYVVAGVRHEDLHYYRSDKTGFGPRLKHALVSTVVTRKTTTRRKTVASGRISGSMGGGLIATAWQPAGFSAAGGVASGGISLGASAAMNVAREFWPRHRNRLAW